MDLRNKRVFISGPMSSHETLNVGLFAEAHLLCKRAGAVAVYDPALESLESSARDLQRPHTYWMRKCIATLVLKDDGWRDTPENNCFYDVLVSLPGWQESDGAKTERMVAEACGIECIELSEVEPC